MIVVGCWTYPKYLVNCICSVDVA